jgi:hypothetical protein
LLLGDTKYDRKGEAASGQQTQRISRAWREDWTFDDLRQTRNVVMIEQIVNAQPELGLIESLQLP